jgi:hypothetical protein
MAQFDKQHWAEACSLFANLLERFPEDGPALFYHRLSEEYVESPVSYDRSSVVRLETE